ncbi:MAG: DegT/DnrJ/EryC1/StrS family aminotransferase [Pseudomonadota bacterium]
MVPLFKPLIEQDEFEAIRQALELGWLGMGSYVNLFEEAIKEHIQASDRYVAAVNTGTSALHLGLLLADVGEGDEVITPAFNFLADYQAITQTGAEVVFCDVLDDTLCIDLSSAEKMISPRTKAIIVMDYDCMLCDHDQVAAFAQKHQLRVIHDAAHSFGSSYNGRKIGSFSDICMFSFDAVKTITSLDGGALVVKTPEELKQIHEWRFLGMQNMAEALYQNKRPWSVDVEEQGYRYHLINLHAAMGLAQLKKINTIAQSRCEAGRYYNEKLAKLPMVQTPDCNFTELCPFLYFIRVPAEHRDSLRTFMKEEKAVDTGFHWRPGHYFSRWKACKRSDLTVTEKIANEVISLPLHSKMEKETLDQVIEAIYAYFHSL